MRRLLVLALAAALLGGCASLPTWVPLVGGKGHKKDAGAAPVRPSLETATPPTVTPPPASVATRAPESDDVTDRIVAVVNNDAITLGELQESIVAYHQENRERTGLPPDSELTKQFLDSLIDTRLELQEAEREKITVDDVELNEEFQERIKHYNVSSEEEFAKLIKPQGLTIEGVKKRLREALRVNKVIRRKVTMRVTVTEQEITQYLTENRVKLETGLAYHASNILVTPDNSSEAAWEAARAKAADIRSRLLAGADFAQVAKEESKDASARDGGDLGTLKRGELSPDIEAAILKLEPGEISQPFRSALGYHVFRLESKEALEGEALERARQQIRDILFRQKYESRLREWLKEIKQRAIIEVRM